MTLYTLSLMIYTHNMSVPEYENRRENSIVNPEATKTTLNKT